MPEILQELSPESLAAAVHRALVTHLREIPGLLPAWRLIADGPLTLLQHAHAATPLDGRPVGAATAVDAGGVVSLCGIGTLAEVRGRGVGRALTLRACLDARARGYRIATLHATPLGMSVYRKLGFVEAGGMQFFFAPAP